MSPGSNKSVSVTGGPVSSWTTGDVREWLGRSGFQRYAAAFSAEHSIDGPALLLLTEADLRQPPMSISVLGDVKKLWRAIHSLQRSERPADSSSFCDAAREPVCTSTPKSGLPPFTYQGHIQSSEGSVSIGAANGFVRVEEEGEGEGESNQGSPFPVRRGGLPKNMSQGDRLIAQVESPDTRTKSYIKTGIAMLYCSLTLLLTSFVMVIVHDRVPDTKMYPPLPDLFLDNVPLIPWAFEVCEMIACFLGVVWMLVLVFHKHRVILLRRMCSLTGTVFLLRCITMLITSLSVPGVHQECAARAYGSFSVKLQEAFKIWFGMGMSLRGVRTCGDYMFSGHTTAITLLNHFITEYTPEHWYNLHTGTWVLNLFGIFFILAAHEHYSIDVFIAFYISSRLFLYYHSLGIHGHTTMTGDHRTRIWFPLFWFFESGGAGRVPNEYEWPLPTLASVRSALKSLLSTGDSAELPPAPQQNSNSRLSKQLKQQPKKSGKQGSRKSD